MARKIEVILSRIARDEIKEILDYIQIDSPASAAKTVATLYDSLKDLPRFPKSGRMIPELGEPSLREIIVGSYRLMYRLEKKRIVILRVLHSRRYFGDDF